MRTCYGIIFLRPDGSDANRVDYYTTRNAALRTFNKSTDIHGMYPNGAPRWVLVSFTQTSGDNT